MNLQFIQLNVRKSALASSNLQMRVSDAGGSFCCLIQEPSLYKNRLNNVPAGADRFPSPFITDKPRAAIFASSELRFLELPSLEDRDTTVCLAKLNGRRTVIASVYLDIDNEDVISEKLRSISLYASANNCPLIIGMDSNCHSTLFGLETNRRGEKLEDFVMDEGFEVENVGTTPTFQSSRYATCIDVTLTRGLQNVVKKWRVDESCNASDHNTILFEVSTSLVTYPSCRKWEKTDWVLFSSELERAEFFRPEKITDYKLDKLVAKVYKIINAALDIACPKTTPKARDPVNEWYDGDIAEIRSEVSNLYNIARRTPRGSREWSNYKSAQKSYRSKIRSSKRKCWNLYKKKCTTAKQTSKLVKILERKDLNRISTFTKSDGSQTMPGKETAEFLLSKHFPSSTSTRRVKYTHYKVPSYEVEGRFNTWISEELVVQALAEFANNKSPGPDELKPIIFQYFPKNIISIITYIYKACISLSFTPTEWRKAKVIFIPKPGKKDYTIYSSFRPISLSNYLLKGLERLTVWRVDQALIEFPLHDSQHGFRCDRSTETAISSVANEIERNIFKRKHVLAVFLDIKSAFDSISPEHIRRSLLNHRAPAMLVEWYYNYIKCRNLTFELQDTKVDATVGVGFPQGGVASARFWLVAFNMAVKLVNTNNCKGVAFADDCAVLRSSTPSTAVKDMQRVLDSLVSWGNRCGLVFNPSKTVAVMFSRRKVKDYRKVKMNGIEVEYSSSVKYLGVTLDRRLDWKEHILNKISAAKKLMFTINQAVRGNWGPSPELSLWAFTGIVRTSLTYAAFCWAHAVTGKKINKELNKIDRLGMKSVAQCAPSTPTEALRIIFDVPPLRLFLSKLAVDTFLRYSRQFNLDWDGLTRSKNRKKSHIKYSLDLARELELDFHDTDDIRAIVPSKKFRIVTDSLLGQKKFLCPAQYNIYTDGSKTDSGVGSGFVVYKNNEEILAESHKLEDFCTVFQAEIFAIFEAIRALLHSPLVSDVKFLKIFTDSSAALLALRKRKARSRVVFYTIKILNRLAEQGVYISLVWIKAHVGHVGNERADELAKAGTELGDEEVSWVARPFLDLTCATGKSMRKSWAQHWESYKEARMSKQFYKAPSSVQAKTLLKLNREEITTIITMTTGHNDLRYHHSLRDASVHPACRLCRGEHETFYHLFTTCPRLNEIRFKVTGVYQLQLLSHWSYDKIIDFCALLPFPLREPRFNPRSSLSEPDMSSDVDN